MAARASLIIPCRDEPRVGAAIAAVLAQAGADAIEEILVVGSAAPELTPELAPANAATPVRMLANPGARTPGANRNTGAAWARGERLIFLDADCEPRPGWLAALLTALERADAVSGAVVLDGGSYWATAYNVATFHEFRAGAPAGPRPYLPSLTLAIRREAWALAGRFDEELPRCEDLDWTIRLAAAGGTLVLEPAALVEHRPGGGAARAWAKWEAGGYYSALVRRRYPGVAYDTHAAGLLARPGLLRALAPIVALGVTARIYRQPDLWHYAPMAPAVWLTKLAWCFGAARRADEQRGGGPGGGGPGGGGPGGG
jgi:GT2 family glycosyltransferase